MDSDGKKLQKDPPKISFIYPKISDELRTYNNFRSIGIIFLDNISETKIINFGIDVFAIDLLPEKDYVLNIQLQSSKVDINHFSSIFPREKYLTIDNIRTISYTPNFSAPELPEGKYSIHANLIEVQNYEDDDHYQGKVIHSKSMYLLLAKSGDING